MEGLITSLLDACKSESLSEVKNLFTLLVKESGEADEITGESFLVWLDEEEEWECDCFSFNKQVEGFCERHITEDPEYMAYYVKLAFGTVHDWRPLMKRVTQKTGIDASVFIAAGDLEDVEEAKDFAESRSAPKRMVEAIEECWREDEVPTTKRIKV
jgi:hypothetical protein